MQLGDDDKERMFLQLIRQPRTAIDAVATAQPNTWSRVRAIILAASKISEKLKVRSHKVALLWRILCPPRRKEVERPAVGVISATIRLSGPRLRQLLKNAGGKSHSAACISSGGGPGAPNSERARQLKTR